jgi:glutamine amidotransferase
VRERVTDVALIDAGGANLGSVRYALERLGVTPRIVRDADGLAGADRVILPGVGAAAPAMRALRAQGLVEALRDLKVPLLGVCLGMQLLYESSEEGETPCLGLLPGRVKALRPAPGIRIPHMGWNALSCVTGNGLLQGIRDGDRAYFVHGYAAPVDVDVSGTSVLATAHHGEAFAAIVRHGLYFGAQFHPERSSALGSRLLENFIRWVP